MATDKPVERTFFSTVPNLRIVLMDAPGISRSVHFAGHALVTSDPAVIEYCDSCADCAGSYIYTKDIMEEPSLKVAAKVAQSLAEKAHDKLVAVGQAPRE